MAAEGLGRSVFPVGGGRVSWAPGGGAAGGAGAAALPVPVMGRGGGGGGLLGLGSRFAISPLSLSLDQLLFLITAGLLCFGLIMVQSADSRIRGTHENWLATAFSNKNMVHAALAVLAMTVAWRVDYRWLLGRGEGGFKAMLRSPATWLVVLTVGFLAAVLVLPKGKFIGPREMNGARRWFGIGTFGFQPSELAKLALVLFVSAFAVRQAAVVRSFWKGFVPLVMVFGAVAALVVKEDFGTTALISLVVMALFLMAGCRLWQVLLLIPPGVVVVWAAIFRDPTSFRYRRFVAFLNPESDPQGVGYHPLQSLLTIVSGGFWGRGLGNGIQKMGYLPEDNTDFIFAVICEELGFVGAALVIGLFVAFVLVGWRVMSRCHSLFGKMVAFGITAVIGVQAAINIAVVTVSMPTKGIALPLISSGGTGWIMNAAAIGVLMSIERVTRREEEERVLSGMGPGRGFPVEVHAVVEAVPVVGAVPAGT
jgi:cell division protein FtsW